MTLVILKLPNKTKHDECSARRCYVDSEVILEQRAATPYERERVEFCDKHFAKHCEEKGGES